MSNSIYYDAVTRLQEKYKTEDDQAELPEYSKFQAGDSIKCSFDGTYVHSFLELDEVAWSSLQVSSISKFDDLIWDWSKDCSPISKHAARFHWERIISENSNLLDSEYAPLLRVLKILLFYQLPNNALVKKINSYTTSVIAGKDLFELAKILIKCGIFVDQEGNGSYINSFNLSKSLFYKYLYESDSPSKQYSIANQVYHWQELSKGKLIPEDFRLNNILISDDELKQFRMAFDGKKGQWQPIPIDTLSEMITFSCDYISKYSERILDAYDVFFPLLNSEKSTCDDDFDWDDAIDFLLEDDSDLWGVKAFGYESKSSGCFSSRKIVRECKKRGIKTLCKDNDSIEDVFHEINSLGVDVNSFANSTIYNVANIRYRVTHALYLLRSSCTAIVLATTGMRRSEFSFLETGNFWLDAQNRDTYRLKLRVFKTSDSPKGDWLIIPIPKITYTALCILDRLTKAARVYSGSPYLTLNYAYHFGTEINPNTINSYLESFCEELGVDHVHPHQFRKTLAMFAIYKDHRNIGVIKRLFSHKSLAMTLAYIVKLPGMSDEIKAVIVDNNKLLLSELLEAIDTNVVGGGAGLRIKTSIKSNPKFMNQLYDDGWETLDQYIDVLLDEGLSLLHRAPLDVICTRAYSDISLIGIDTCTCNVVDCSSAVFTRKSISKLHDDIRFHLDLVSSRKDISVTQTEFSQKQLRNCLDRLVELEGLKKVGQQYNALLHPIGLFIQYES